MYFQTNLKTGTLPVCMNVHAHKSITIQDMLSMMLSLADGANGNGNVTSAPGWPEVTFKSMDRRVPLGNMC